jgi:hypothetical protein
VTISVAALVVSIASALFAALAARYTARQAHQAKVANAFPAVIDMFREYRGPLSTARSRVFDLIDEAPETAPPLGDLPPDLKQPAIAVCHFLDNLGVLVAEGLMDSEIAARYLGDTAIALWKRLLPYIEAERNRRLASGIPGAADYLRYFEHLVVTLEELNPEHTRMRLKRWDAHRLSPGAGRAGLDTRT